MSDVQIATPLSHAAAVPSSVSAPDSPLSLRRVAGRIGAEVTGLRLSAGIDAASFDAVLDALHTHKVLFFRGQHHLDDDAQQAFARRFGETVAHPTVPPVDGTALLELDSAHGARANSWHTDVTFVEAYPKVSILRAVVIPPAGGDTVWANTAAAYAHLPDSLRELADTLWAVHTNAYDYASSHVNADADQLKRYREVFTSTVYETLHPVVRVHPVTQERTLVLGHFVQRIQGLSASDSAHLLQVLHEHVTRLENTVRWSWREGDVAIWDNRATQHYAINDYGDARRVVRRATVHGDVPVGVDGRASVALKGGTATLQ
ncbi:TauD/TfdA dioxygenase family protein [Burkholderia plantarii]|uniref:Taurine dioxygenase n=1 Tax=Burkholderia plantarii TaxID=41899 RepID=A0A0B6S223_BURPL|nr:TauD/TfdA family dioxygenase [Burkholderia plantarii]AJK49728.1 taurine dioxygenase [Burkholderia plantarii]WLE63000.1 TauD/TfdA family dioxygenase [Burkholderia plantarii]